MNRDEFIEAFFDVFNRALYFSQKARSEGLLSLEEELENEKNDYFRLGLRLTVDGTESSIIDKILSNIRNQEKDEDLRLLKTIQKEVVMMIHAGENPRLLAIVLNSYTDIPLNDPRFQKLFDDYHCYMYGDSQND
jgi:flagellar motor component MotA